MAEQSGETEAVLRKIAGRVPSSLLDKLIAAIKKDPPDESVKHETGAGDPAEDKKEGK